MELNDAQLNNQTGGQIDLLIQGTPAGVTVVNPGNTSPILEGTLLTIIVYLPALYSADASSFPVTLFQTESPYDVTLWFSPGGQPDHLTVRAVNGKQMADIPLTRI